MQRVTVATITLFLTCVVSLSSHSLSARDETLSRSSRRTGLVISEIMYRPALREDGRVLEFVELYNSDLTSIKLDGWRLTGTIDYSFPAKTTLEPGDFLVIAKVPDDIQAVYGIDNVIGNYSGSLNTGDGAINLRHPNGGILLTAEYLSAHPWPAAAAGAGHSLVLNRPSYGEGSVEAWRASTYKGGSPGEIDPPATDALRHIRINEFLAHTDSPLWDYIELYNHSTQPADLSGAYLSDKPDENRFQIPAGTIIEPGGFVVFYEAPDREHPGEGEFNFGLRASGEGIYLVDPANTRVIDAIRFGPQLNFVSMGRYPDGGEEFYLLAERTPGAPNGAMRPRDIVINEIMFNPISGLDEDTYVELYNNSSETIDLSDWRFVDGINFVIPNGTLLEPDSYLVVAKDKQRLQSRYPQLNTSNTVGDFGGRLADSGERIALAKPVQRSEEPTMYVVVEEVTYRDGGRWGRWANRDGSSLELIDPRSNGRLAANWTHSDERDKSEWFTIEHTGVLDHGQSGQGGAHQLHILMPSAGVFLIDNVEVFVQGAANRIVNSTFESGISGWVAQGNHVRTRWHTEEGYSSSRSLRVEATGGGDTGANRIKVELTSAFSPGQTVTIRAKARWLAGHPDIILRVKGNYLEAVGHAPIPTDLGTPGMQNSVYAANIGPAIYNVRHYPTLPQANEPITITAQACDPDGVSSMLLRYRLDPSSTWHTLVMQDNGQNGDVLAGDGIFTAVIPGQSNGTLIAYHVEATDAHPVAAIATFPDDISAYEALVRVGDSEPEGRMPTYLMWFTKAVWDELQGRERPSNQRLPGTLVYGDRVIHNIGIRYRGSPFRRPSGYSFHTPRDNRLLGAREFNLNRIQRGTNNDDTGQRERTGYWIAEQLGLPFSHQSYIHLYINGSKQLPVYTDIHHIDSDYIRTWFPDNDAGELFKIDDWFEFNDALSSFSSVNAQLGNYTTTGGVKKQARYRWNWNKRSNRWMDDDYSNLFQLVDAVHTQGQAYTAAATAIADIDQWMRIFALRRIVSDWDGYGYNRGKNAWTYKPAGQRWNMILWDIDKGIGAWNSPTNAALFGANDPVVTRMYNHPPFRRAYLRVFYEAVHGPMMSDQVNPLVDAQYAALQDEGVYVDNPSPIKSWIAARRTYIIGVLNNEASGNFAITTNGGNGFSTSSPLLSLQGVAPLNIKTLTFNGRPYPVTWNSVTGWTAQIPLQPGANPILVEGLDSWDRPIEGLGTSITIHYTGTGAAAESHLVINEIMYNPVEPDAEFVEIHNTSTTHGFDLTGYRLRGIDFDFADGTLIPPGGFLVIAKDIFAFCDAYGFALPVVGEYNGRLHPEGERLRLVRLATDTEEELILDEVTYGVTPPWPAAANGQGSSLQRIDPEQCGNHPGNWAAATENPPTQEPKWQFVTFTGVANPNSSQPSDRIYIYLESAGEFHIDDMFLAQGSVPEVGHNYIQNGDFEQPLDGTWVVATNHAGSSITTAVKHSGSSSLHVVASSGGTTASSAIAQYWDQSLPHGETFTLSYWYLPNPNGATLTVRVRYSDPQYTTGGIINSHSVLLGDTLPLLQLTPGTQNSVRTSLPPFEPLWINEVQPINTGGFTDGYGQANPWVELYNAGDQAISLADHYLSNDYDQLGRWKFPSGAEIGPSQYRIVWLDGQPEKTTANEWHAGFVIDPDIGSLILSRRVNSIDALVDWLDYEAILPGLSYGRFPDGSSETAQPFYVPTPGYANDATGVPLLHYWHFNELPSGILTAVSADYSVNPGALITYPGSGAGYMDRVNDGTTLNARMLEPAGYGLRVRNPADTRQLLLTLPTTGYQNILLSYAVTRTTFGAAQQSVYYRLGGTDPWVLWADAIEITENYQVFAFDFSGVAGIDDNPEFAVRILFGGANASAASGNNRFDNITLEGLPLVGTNVPPQLNETMPFTQAIEQMPVVIDLSVYFTDPDGDELTFTAQADKPLIVHATASGNLLTLTPLYRGDATVTVSAFDGHNPAVETSFRLLVFPAAHTLRLGAFGFDYWPSDAPENTFPTGMLFLQSDISDPVVDTPLLYPYYIPHDDYHADDQNKIGKPYSTTGRTRLTGEGQEGIYFINTGRGRDLGGALTAIDTTGLEGVHVNWLCGTILENSRRYAIRLQYRLGIDGPFADVLDNGQPVEYVVEPGSGTNGHTQEFARIDLPQEVIDQPYVQLLWRYYYIPQNGITGARAQLRLDDIAVFGVLDLFENLGLFAQWWLQTDCELYDHCGGADLTRDGIVNLEDFAIIAGQWLF